MKWNWLPREIEEIIISQSAAIQLGAQDFDRTMCELPANTSRNPNIRSKSVASNNTEDSNMVANSWSIWTTWSLRRRGWGGSSEWVSSCIVIEHWFDVRLCSCCSDEKTKFKSRICGEHTHLNVFCSPRVEELPLLLLLFLHISFLLTSNRSL